ncbi:MAG: hypothetical protein JNK47_20065 [Mesorhizobium sp.]|nr:hypothetical protein [Mesorhizobium sp.]MBL8579506.1 hypothetical protein [Mesorhizobium sp.]
MIDVGSTAKALQSAIAAVFAVLLTAAVLGAILALIGAVGDWPEIKSLGAYAAAIGATGFFGWMVASRLILRVVASGARHSDIDSARR